MALDRVEHSFDRRRVVSVETKELERIADVELVEELSLLTTQAARMRARMADIVAELDRRRNSPMRSHAASPW